MLRITPRYLERLDPTSDRTLILFRRLGVPDGDLSALRGRDVVVSLPASPSRGRELCAATLVDYLVRLQPLVRTVCVDSPDADRIIGDLPLRFPVDHERAGPPPEASIRVAVGAVGDSYDLVVDGNGWVTSIGELCPPDDSANPIGPLAAAALAAGEVFKFTFADAYPEQPLSRRFVPHRGFFSFWDYTPSTSSPVLRGVRLDAILVGAGGVGAAVVCAVAALRDTVAGELTVVDPDRLDMYNLNRVLYATLADASAGVLKVNSVERHLASATPELRVVRYPVPYQDFARETSRRVDRRYPLVITGLDQDDIRWEVQRDLPRILIDGSTGADANLRVERILFGQAGCIGCSHPPAPPPSAPIDPAECDVPPDPHAPSISFLSGLTGTLVAGEMFKLATTPDAAINGSFEHLFIYGPNSDLRGRPSRRPDCPVACQDPAVVEAYRQKWGGLAGA